MITASAPVGTLQPIPDAATALPPASGVPAHVNFRSVLEHAHEARESDAKADDPKSSRDQKQQKDPDPATTLAAPVTPPTEAPRLNLPFTSSFTLRQDANKSADDASAQDTTASADDTATTQNSTTAADSKAPAIFRSTLDVLSLPQESAPKTNTVPSGARQRLLAKLQAKSQESVASKTIDAPADPSAPVLPVTTSTTLDQAATAVKTSSTVNEAPATATTSTSTVDRGAFILADSRKAAYQYHSSHEAGSATAPTSRAVQQPQKVSDSTATITVPVPVTETAEPQRLIHTPAPSNTPRQDAPTAQNNSAAAQDSLNASATDSKTALPPAMVQADDTTTAPPTGSLAFAARLTPTEETPAPASTATPDASRPADSQSRMQTALQSATPGTAKEIASEADQPSDAHSGESGSQSDKENRFAKPEMMLPQTHTAFQDQSTAAAASHASATPLSPAARMDQVQEPTTATAPSGNHDITIRIPDSNTDQGTAVRFVERAGEIHVSVRTGDAEMAQTLRGGLNDLVNRLEDGGIRTQVWQPGTDSSTSQNDSHHPFADPDGSNGRQYSSGSNSEQESKQQSRPRWVEELEGSIGNPNFKETTQLLWQA